jgi:hypothetical protein
MEKMKKKNARLILFVLSLLDGFMGGLLYSLASMMMTIVLILSTLGFLVLEYSFLWRKIQYEW